MYSFQGRFREYVEMVERALPGYLPDRNCPQGDVVDAMSYSLTGGGKRIRGVLLLAVYGLFSGAHVGKALPFACAMEMIHAYSLIHDDLPCMDDDDLRRGKPSCHIAYGEAVALLAGDALLTLAFQTCAGEEPLGDFGGDRALRAVAALAAAAGAGGMVGGQVMDLQNEGKDVPPEDLRRMDELKTGALILAAARIGCILGGAEDAVTGKLADFALKLGLAFQIRDDILDQTADTAVLGKPAGSDGKKQKSTYTGHFGVDGAREAAAKLSAEAKAALEETGLDCRFLRDLTDMLLDRTY